MNLSRTAILLIVVTFGAVVPFVPILNIFQMLALLFPFILLFLFTLLYLVLSFFIKEFSTPKALIVFSILPLFILAQLASGITVDKTQRFRSNQIISEIEKIQTETGILPEEYAIFAGIEYVKIKDAEKFELAYSRGFLVTERYDSTSKKWKSYGWND